MKEVFHVPIIIPVLAQMAPVQSEWERIGITGLSILVTIFIWRYFTALQDAKDKANIAERERLLKEGNDKTQEIIDLLKQQLADARSLTTGEQRVHTVIENTSRHPVPVKPHTTPDP